MRLQLGTDYISLWVCSTMADEEVQQEFFFDGEVHDNDSNLEANEAPDGFAAPHARAPGINSLGGSAPHRGGPPSWVRKYARVEGVTLPPSEYIRFEKPDSTGGRKGKNRWGDSVSSYVGDTTDGTCQTRVERGTEHVGFGVSAPRMMARREPWKVHRSALITYVIST